LKVNIDQVSLDLNAAILCGLIINELVSNALKHAFPAGRKGEIRIDLRRDPDGRHTLRISDNGVGFPEGLDFRNTTSLGLQLVHLLTDQLRGTVELHNHGRTSFEIRFAA